MKKDNPIAKYIKKRVHKQNKNLLGAFVGETGSGKSYAAIRMGEVLNKNFTNEKIFLDPKKFLKYCKNKATKGDVLIMDEAGVGLPSREWWSESNKVFNYVTQTFRKENLIVLFTLPHLGKMDKQSRNLLHVVFPMVKQGKAKTIQMRSDPIDGNTWPRYMKLKGEKYKYAHFSLPKNKELLKNYEKRKDRLVDELYDKAIQGFDEEKNKPKTVRLRKLGDKILNNGVNDYIKEYKTKGGWRVDKNLLRIDHDLTKDEADMVKSYIESKYEE